MSNVNFIGTINNFDGAIETDGDVRFESDGNGNFKLVANGHNLSFAGVTKLVLKQAGVSEGAAQVNLPSGESRFISSERSSGAGERAEEGSTFTPVYQGKAANQEIETEESPAPVEEPSIETEEAPTEVQPEAPAEAPASEEV